MFRFANPEMLYLLAALPVAVVIYIVARVVRRRRLNRFGNPQTLRLLMPEASSWRNGFKFFIWAVAFVLVIFAAARPQVGSKLSEKKSRGIEMVLAIDVSNSMLADDFEPSRLERTKYAVDKLIDRLEQEHIGVVVFAGEAQVQLPVTSDYRMAKAFVKRISPSLVSVQGTAVGSAIETSILTFSPESGNSRAIILITDGETHDANALDAASYAAGEGIRIFTIGIGTPEGAPIHLGDDYIRDESGEMVVSKLDEGMLQSIAAATQGAYVRATRQSIGLDEIVSEIKAIEQRELSVVRFDEYDEKYPYLLWTALVLLVVEVLVFGHRNPLLARFDIFTRSRGAKE